MQPLAKETQTLENTAAKLQTLALKAGAERCEVFATYATHTKFTLEKQDYHLGSSDDGYQFGLRVTLGERQGFASTNLLESAGLKNLVEQAVTIAKLSPENPYNVIASSDNIPHGAPMDLWDDALHRSSIQTQRQLVKLLMDEACRDKRFRVTDGTFSIQSGLGLLINSLGIHRLVRETSANWSLMGMAVDGDRITSFDYFSQFTRTQQALPDKVRATTQRFTKRVVDSLQQGEASSYRGFVVFSPRATADVLISAIAHHLNGRNVVEKTGRWNLSEVGKPVLSSQFSLVDDPWRKELSGCSSFDREGTPTRPVSLMDEGRLKTFLLDHYCARALGLCSNGSAGGGATSIPTVSAHSLNVLAGTRTRDELEREVTAQQKDFLVVDRFSGETDPISGDFSGVAKSAEWFHQGERAYFLKETLISGNVFDVLGNSLLGISRETEIVDSSGEFPTVIAGNVSVTRG